MDVFKYANDEVRGCIPDFIIFLIDNEAYDNFFSQAGTITFHTSPEGIIDIALYWAGTKEGHAYWSDLHDKWREELD